MNFIQRKVARESVEGTGTVVPDGLELPAESVEGILADLQHDTRVIDGNDADAAVLAEDADETDAQLDSLDAADAAADPESDLPEDEKMDAEEDMPNAAAEALDVAQESIRRRWGFDHRQAVARESYGARNRRQVARESLWDDIKAFLQRIIDWLKEQGRKLKDRWLKFSNVGKSIQGRASKYEAQIRALGKQTKDEISGGFVKQLSVGGKFVGDNGAVLNEQLALCTKKVDFLAEITDVGEELVSTLEAAGNAETASAANAKKLVTLIRQNADGEEELLGGSKMVIKTEGEGDEATATISFVASEAEGEGKVKTPGPAQLSTANTFYKKVGVELEKQVQNYRKVDAARAKYEKSLEALVKRVDGVKIDEKPGLARAVRVVRRGVTGINATVSSCERMVASIQKNLTSGLNGYIAAGIAAHSKG
ncbi:hypothetical protein pEaSNUABM11_00068 [Erwinia phage pEa_SNUABM_11]|nr:hypothetical protein pEaSNUABM11_00068 [Erwinia phage pEa_SNUABM_11]